MGPVPLTQRKAPRAEQRRRERADAEKDEKKRRREKGRLLTDQTAPLDANRRAPQAERSDGKINKK